MIAVPPEGMILSSWREFMLERITKRGLWSIIAVLLAAQSLDLLASGMNYFVGDSDSSFIPLLLFPLALAASCVWMVAAVRRKEPFINRWEIRNHEYR